MRRKIPSSNTLLCFDAAARHRSLTRAAVELSLTQSAVSRQILALEETLGTTLFKRTRHGMELTPVGVDYAARVAQRLGAMEQDTLDIMGASAPGLDVHLASVPTFAAQWLIPRLGDFAKAHPGITVHIETRTRPFLFADTALDAAIYAGTPEQLQRWAGTHCLHLLDEAVVLVCHPRLLGKRKSLKAETLAGMPLLFTGDAAFELEILDSVTGERLYAAADKRVGKMKPGGRRGNRTFNVCENGLISMGIGWR